MIFLTINNRVKADINKEQRQEPGLHNAGEIISSKAKGEKNMSQQRERELSPMTRIATYENLDSVRMHDATHVRKSRTTERESKQQFIPRMIERAEMHMHHLYTCIREWAVQD